jgi:hypothetical protein
MADTLKKNLSDTSTWLRLLYMLLFGIVIELALMVMFAIFFIQFLLKLFSAKVNTELQKLGDSLGAYFHQIVSFLTYRSEYMPYPFAPWPKPGAASASRPAARRRRLAAAKSNKTQE